MSDEQQRLLNRYARAAIDHAASGALKGQLWRTATIVNGIDPGRTGAVQLDGDSDSIEVSNLCGISVGAGARVMVQFRPPSAAEVVAYISGPTWIPYTPVYSGGFITIGNGSTIDAQYRMVGDTCHCHGTFDCGTTSDITGTVSFTVAHNVATSFASGTAVYGQAGTDHAGAAVHTPNEGIDEFRLKAISLGAPARFTNLGTGLPIDWTDAGASFSWDVIYQAAFA
jgi:hypothetical protein